MARTTISIPDKLKEKMNLVNEDVNWSAVAAKAFEKKLEEISANNVEFKLQDVAERLRKSKLEYFENSSSNGFSLGQVWATNLASYEELQRLQRIKECTHPSDWGIRFYSTTSGFLSGDLLACELRGESTSKDISHEFWEKIFLLSNQDKKTLDEEFVYAFIDGALEVYAQVSKFL